MFIDGIIWQCNSGWKYGKVFQCKSDLDLAYFTPRKFIDEKISWATPKFSRQCKTVEICSQKGNSQLKNLLIKDTVTVVSKTADWNWTI